MIRLALASLSLAVMASPAAAKVHETAPDGFVLRHGIDVSATPEATFRLLLDPAQWWSKAHSFSGDPANFSLDPRAGGCFCEILPSEVSPNAAPRGSVEHMRVILVDRPRALRLSGALGPLQATAASGTLTIFLRPVDGGTRILMEYVVGGFMRGKTEALAQSVDLVLNEQVLNLGRTLGVGPGSESISEPMTGAVERAEPEADTITEPTPEEAEIEVEPVADAFGAIMWQGIEDAGPEREAPPEPAPADRQRSEFEGR